MEKHIQNGKKGLCIALGFFDSMHLGHRAILDCTKRISAEKGLISAIFTFSSLNKKDEHQVYLLKERKELYRECGIEEIIVYDFTRVVMNTSPESFLDGLVDGYGAKAFVCGSDYRFGKNAEGDISLLESYCEKRNITLKIVETVTKEGERVSSTLIKELMARGEIAKANELLGKEYSVTGRVVHGRGEGHIFGFPTANIAACADKLYPAPAVYATRIIADGKLYRAVTNIGNKPTFNDGSWSIESYITDFSGDLYGKEIKLIFVKRLREIRKFSSPERLREAIISDSKWEE